MQMEQQFVETIKIKDGKALNLSYHQARMERTIQSCFTPSRRKGIPLIGESLSTNPDMVFFKARVLYGEHGIEDIQYAPYAMRKIHSLKIVTDNDIDYAFKSTDRSELDRLTAQKGDCDDVVIVKNGLVTDTSFTNIAVFIDGRWLTPRCPLLMGTKRASLIDKGILNEADITPDDLMKAEKVSLINAMIELEESVVVKLCPQDDTSPAPKHLSSAASHSREAQ